MKKDYPYLDTLIGGWLHQDFDSAGDMLEEVVTAYNKVHAADAPAGVRADIE